ncbi:hypothetical protein CYY_006301 [Polysphondylium violaceum]|uniref:PH domain-containing protein n=1 Tax=Polysphondylium violaceum TaxID=133409 RepID=A0A8J4PRK6_9MYCE|nr:hypothetical protein CYY_006301 [Polysphondylium violaceum]
MTQYTEGSPIQTSPSLYPSLVQQPIPADYYDKLKSSYSGYLSKKGDKGVVLLWKKRYFIVDLQSIRYYTDSNAKEQKGTIEWDTVKNIQFSKFSVWDDRRYFEILTNSKRVYYLFSEDQVISLEWVENIKKILQHYKILKESPPLSPKPIPVEPPQPEDYRSNIFSYEQQQQSQTNQNKSMYKDFLNFAAPTFSHYDSIGTPIQSDNSALHTPPRPPGPLRELNQDLIKDILPTEGRDLDDYYKSTVYFSNLIMASGSDYSILSCYLILSILDWDNKKTQPLPFPCTPPYESDIVFPYFTYLLQLTRNEIINRWQEGATYCTQIDTFSKKKRKNFSSLLENEDRETFLQRNLLLLNFILKTLISSRMAIIEDSLLVLIDRFLENYETLPSFKYSQFLWKEIENNNINQEHQEQQQLTSSQQLQASDKLILKNFLMAYLYFQKLSLEKKNNTRLILDSSTNQKFESISQNFSRLLHQHPVISRYQGNIQRATVRIFFLWQKDLPLCESTTTFEISMYRYYKVFSRMLSKIHSCEFAQLFNSVQDIKDSLYKHIEPQMTAFDINLVDSTSIDSIITI